MPAMSKSSISFRARPTTIVRAASVEGAADAAGAAGGASRHASGAILKTVVIVIIVITAIVVGIVLAEHWGSDIVITVIEIHEMCVNHGNGLYWDAQSERLFMVDTNTSTLYRFNPVNGTVVKLQFPGKNLRFFMPVNGVEHGYIAGFGPNLTLIVWDGHSRTSEAIETIAEIKTRAKIFIQVVDVDSRNRLWAGTVGPENKFGELKPNMGGLWVLENNKLQIERLGLDLPTGLAFDEETKSVYLVDTYFPAIHRYEYKPETGHLKGKREVIFDFTNNSLPGAPSGLVMDNGKCLWVGAIFGSRIFRVDPKEGKLLKTVHFPTPEITSLVFGGKHLDVLYVATSTKPMNGKVPKFPAGCLFKVEGLKVKGIGDKRYTYSRGPATQWTEKTSAAPESKSRPGKRNT